MGLVSRFLRSVGARRSHKAEGDVDTDFLADVSHEMRTPLAAIVNYMELLSDSRLTDGQASHVDAAHDAATAMIEMLDNAIHFSRPENTTSPTSQEFNVRSRIDQVARMMAAQAFQKKLDFFVTYDSNVPEYATGDPLQLRQVLQNLLSNAIKFTRSGEIRMHTSYLDADGQSHLVFSVADTGCGISSSEMAFLFHPFSRLPGRDPDVAGSGLGLAITKRLVASMAGQITVDSAPGCGSTFWVRLPVTAIKDRAGQRQDLQGDAAVLCADPGFAGHLESRLSQFGLQSFRAKSPDELSDRLDNFTPRLVLLCLHRRWLLDEKLLRSLGPVLRNRYRIISLINDGSASSLQRVDKALGGVTLYAPVADHTLREQLQLALTDSSRTPESHRTAIDDGSLSGMCILIADDDRFTRQYLSTILGRAGATVETCSDGRAACKQIESSKPDLVIMDVRMPACDGIEATTVLRSKQINLPIIGLTASATDQQAALAAGMNACFIKPTTAGELLEFIREVQCPGPDTQPIEFFDQEMLDDLLRELPLQAQRLNNQWQRRDLPAMREEAHKLNGTASLCDFTDLQICAERIEISARDGTIDNIDGMLAELDEVIATTCQQLARAAN